MSPCPPYRRLAPGRLALALTLATCLAGATPELPSAQPRPSGLSPTRWGVVYDVPATRDVKVLANVPYASDAAGSLAIDVYLPPRLARGEKLPVIVFINTIGDRTGDSPKDWEIYRSWPRLVATQGFAGVSMQADSANPQESLRRLFAFLASGRAPEALDGGRVGVYAASANVTGACRFLFAPGAPPSVRAAVLYYGGPPADSLRRDLPVLFVVAAGDAPGMRTTLDALWPRVVEAGAPWTLEFAAGMPHAFDAFADNDDARRIVQRTIAFWRSHLMPVPQPAWERSRERDVLAALYAHDPERSVALLEPWLAEHPDDREALVSYGQSLNQLKRYPEALAAMERAHRLDTTNVFVLALYGGALVGQSRHAEGARLLQRAIDRGWTSSLTYGQLAYAELFLDHNEQAVRHYERAFEIGIPPGPGTRGAAWYNLACGYARLGRRNDALKALEDAVAEGGGSGMGSDPDFASLRQEPRFKALLSRMPATAP